MNEDKEPKPIDFYIPANISPQDVGAYIAGLMKEDYQTPLASTTRASITAVAVGVDKDKMRVSKFTFQLGADWLPVKMIWECERK